MSGGTLLVRLKRINARSAPEEDLRVRVCVLVAVMTAAMAVVVQGVGSVPFRVLVVGGLPGAYWYSWRTRYREGFWLKVVVAVCALVALAWFVSTITPRAGATFADAEVPLAELFLVIMVLHGLDVPARRDLLFSLLSSLVLMAVAGALSVSMALAPYLIVWAVASSSALVLAHRSELAQTPALAAAPGVVRKRGGALRPVGAVLAFALVGGLAIFFVVPAAGTSRALVFPTQLRNILPVPQPGGLSNPSLGSGDPAKDPGFPGEARPGQRVNRAAFGYFGFSTRMDLSARGRPNG
ncbi:MAG TPA: transglutaminaseTgpA domain-containing protein, partial [Acidimicrobiales bacterium]|nr:transglutaminaseTgpA domain-containing protein [Acidimicrobiales bacterium]